MSVREDRLKSEYQAMIKYRSKVVSWRANHARKPDQYVIFYDLKSIIGIRNGKPRYDSGFEVEISFPQQFPVVGPKIYLVGNKRPLHPNIWEDGRICTEGDVNWIAGIGVPLDALCTMIGEIISFQEVNLGSVANPHSELIDWIRSNLRFITKTKVENPVDSSDVRLSNLEDAVQFADSSSTNRPSTPLIEFG